MIDVRENCRRIVDRMQTAAVRSGRPSQAVQLIAVTKTVAPDKIRQAVDAGVVHIGENRLQEALPKREALRDLELTWHFIGHLQTNKAKKVVENFDWVQSIDRTELAEKLNQAAGRPFPVLIEVRLHEEPNKSGVAETALPGFVEQFRQYERLQLRGFMAIPPFFENAEHARPYFRRLRRFSEQFGLTDLSMGMSNDFQ